MLILPTLAAAETGGGLNALAQSRAWQTLLHYEDSWLLGFQSLSDDDRFFLAEDGKYNARSELAATIKAFQQPGAGDDSAACSFPARFALLKRFEQRLGITLLEPDCPQFEQWRKGINASRVTLVFPSSFINNPASAFGHTFIRLDPAGTPQPLLAYAANYEARTSPADSAFVYAAKGIFGGYQGQFSVEPYYKKVEKYSDLEDRDIWEYHLSLTEEEVQQLVRHLWELRRIGFDYYYFDENCSYQLLSLLEAARPSLTLKKNFSNWVIPVDTVRVLLENKGILEDVVFRPARATTLSARSDKLSGAERKLAYQLAEGEAVDLDERALLTSARTLELAYEVVSYKILASTDEENELRARAHELLARRSKLQGNIPEFVVPTPAVRPDRGHLTSKLGASIGSASGTPFYNLQYRGAYHDILDPEAGFIPGAAIELMTTTLQHRAGQSIKLEQLKFLDARAISPRSEFIKPISWILQAKLDRKLVREERPLIPSFHGGVGLSFKLSRPIFFSLLRLGAEVSGNYRENMALGFGNRSGMLVQFTDRFGMLTEGEVLRFGWGDDHTSYVIGAEARYTLERNVALRGGYSRERGLNSDEHVFSLTTDVFF